MSGRVTSSVASPPGPSVLSPRHRAGRLARQIGERSLLGLQGATQLHFAVELWLVADLAFKGADLAFNLSRCLKSGGYLRQFLAGARGDGEQRRQQGGVQRREVDRRRDRRSPGVGSLPRGREVGAD